MKQCSNRAFTLIELLVVIAIIAILAAILFPVFAQAKLAAKKASDLSNMKQETLAVIMYVGDTDDVYPQVESIDLTNWPVTTADWSSSLVIGPYTKNVDILKSPVDTFGATEPYSFYGLPASRPTKPVSYMPNAISDFGGTKAWGIANPVGIMTSPVAWGGSLTPAENSTAVTHPADVVMLANGFEEYYDKAYGCGANLNNEVDYCYLNVGVYGDWLPIGIDLAQPTTTDKFWRPMYPAWRKFNGGSNFSFADGHAKFMYPSVVDQPKFWLANYAGN